MKIKFRAIALLIIAFVIIGLFVPTGRDIGAEGEAPAVEDSQ